MRYRKEYSRFQVALLFVSIFTGYIQDATAMMDYNAVAAHVKDLEEKAKKAKELADAARQKEQESIAHRDRQVEVYNSSLQLRTETIDLFKKTLVSAVEAQFKSLSDQRQLIQDSGRELQRATWTYLQKQEGLNGRYEQQRQTYLAHQGSEEQVSGTVARHIEALPSLPEASEEIDLIRTMMTLCETVKLERTAGLDLRNECEDLSAQLRNSHRSYSATVAQEAGVKEKFQVPTLPLPEQAIEQLSHMKDYAAARERHISEQAIRVLPEISDRLDQLVRKAAREKTKLALKDYELWLGGMNFLDLVSSFHQRRAELLEDSNANPVVKHRSKLVPFLKFYREVLVYKDVCSDPRATQEGTSFHTGCVLFKPLLGSAKSFFELTAKTRMSLALTDAKKNGPPVIAIFIEQLQTAIAACSGFGEPDEFEKLLQAIVIHDELLMKWKECLTVETLPSEAGAL